MLVKLHIRWMGKAALLLAWGLAQATAPVISTGSSFLNTGLGPLSSAAGVGSPAVLSSPTSGTPSTTSATVGATTNEASGTLYVVADTSGNMSGITVAQIEAGHNNTGAAAAGACNASVASTSPSCTVSSLTVATSYSYAEVQLNGNGTSNIATGTFTTASSGATLIINYPTGFASVGSDVTLKGIAAVSGSQIDMTTIAGGSHVGGWVWTTTPPNVQAFTTKFSFQQPNSGTFPAVAAMTFIVQNSNSTSNPNGDYGLNASGDANVGGYGAFGYNYTQMPQSPVYNPIGNSIAVKYDLNPYSFGIYPNGGHPSTTGLYLNGGPLSQLLGANDLNPAGINLYSGDVMNVVMVYDGTLLTMTIQDATTNAAARYVWPLNLTVNTGSNTAWVGFTADQATAQAQNLLNWQYWTGYATRLATPTFSVTPGHYTSTQSVSLNNCSGGVTCYYTTNGQLPTTNSTAYTGTAISVSASEVLNVVATESSFTDSLVATGNYSIQASATPLINFANFSSPNGLIQLNGYAAFSSSSIQLTDTTGGLSSNGTFEVASAWYASAVIISTFNTTFTYQATSSTAANQYGVGTVFVIQNQPSGLTGLYQYVSGGTTYIGSPSYSLGYGYGPYSVATGAGVSTSATGGILNSVGIKLDLTGGSGNGATGLYTNGAQPNSQTSPDVPITGINLNTGNPITVNLVYNGTTLSMLLTDTVTLGTFSYSWTVNIPTAVGGSTAYVGFTGANSYWYANQFIKAWTM